MSLIQKIKLILLFLLLFGHTYGQGTISGFVLDTNDIPVVGADVFLIHGNTGTITDENGRFIFNNVPVERDKLMISALGFKNIVLPIRAESSEVLHIVLSPESVMMQEIEINADKKGQLKEAESISVLYVEKEMLSQSRGANLMQTLSAIPGINSMKIGSGISKPMIRGLGYYRVVVAQNGIKMEGQQWSNHYGISIDQQAVDHIEIVKGPASLQYGSDAIGGVIHVLPPFVPQKDRISGEISLSGKSNSNWLGTSLDLNLRKGDVYSNLDVTFNAFGDYLIPVTDSFLLPSPVSASEASHKVVLGNRVYNTAGREKAISYSIGVAKPGLNSFLQFCYHATQTGFFDWQGLQYDSIRLLHAKTRMSVNNPYQEVENYSFYHLSQAYINDNKFDIGFGYQLNKAKEYTYSTKMSKPQRLEGVENSHQEDYELGLFLHTFSGNVSYTVNRFSKQSIKAGLSAQSQWHNKDGDGHIIPEYERVSAGFFITHKYTLSENWVINSGIRMDYLSLKTDETLNPEPAVNRFDSLFNPAGKEGFKGTSFGFGFNYLPNSKTILKAHVGKSFRLPSVYELAAYGLHRHEGRFEKGDTENKPEQAWHLDLGFDFQAHSLGVSVSPFANYFTNYLFLNPSPEFAPGLGQIYEYAQTRVCLTGGEGSLDYLYRNHISLNMGVEYVYAVNLDLNRALPFTPPLKFRTEMMYLFNDAKSWTDNRAGIELVIVGSQKFTVPNELNTPGYTIINLKGFTSVRIGKNTINIMLLVRNLLNEKYFDHISFYRRLRIPEPARDIQLFISIPIDNKL